MTDQNPVQEAEIIEAPPVEETVEEKAQELSVETASAAIQQTMSKDMTAKERLDLIQKTVLKNFSVAEISLTVQRAQACWANILAWEMWAYKNSKGELVNILSHKFLIDRLFKNPRVSSMQSGVVYDKDEYISDLSQWSVSHKNIHWMDLVKRWAILGAWCVIWQADGKPYFVEALAKDYDKKQLMWISHKHAMMQKTVEGIAARRFVEIWGSYLAEWEFTPMNEETIPKKITKPDLKQFQK